MKRYLNMATIYLVIGLLGGVFSREFTKLNGFEGQTSLGVIHTHALVLGFFMMLMVMVLDHSFAISKVKHFTKWLVIYNIGVVYLVITLLIRGISEVQQTEISGLNHIAGLGHAILGISMIGFIVILHKAIKKGKNK
ncbi:MAG: DUF2871 domain-containing protein [Cellulosilyticaceae bacterium]